VLENREVRSITPSYVMKGNLVDSTTHVCVLDAMVTALQVHNHVFITTYIIGYYVGTHYNRFGYVELTDYVRLGQKKVMKNVEDRKQPPGDRSKTVYTPCKHYI
jgi:hypothetical protein